ncbi:MAG: hypothetical protein OEZ28_05100 [Nitrospinota bacterium]|nr:hypothetical protein [Nitrospinota bacterium]
MAISSFLSVLLPHLVLLIVPYAIWSNRDIKGRKSWIAYVPSTLLYIILVWILLIIAHKSTNIMYSLMLLFLVAGPFVYKIFLIGSFRLYYNDKGVHTFYGILPWDKGGNSVRWEDISEAVYFTDFTSWLLKSYNIRIGHRFTKTSEIIENHIENGKELVAEIEAKLHDQRRIASPSTI